MSAPDTVRVPHPAPGRGEVPLWLLLFAVSAAPIAWSAQLVVDYAMAALACFPNDVPLARPLSVPAGSRAVLFAVNIAALLIASAGLFVSMGAWGRTHGEVQSGGGGHVHHLMETGEGRTRFMAGCGVLTSLGFIGAILFDTFALAVVPQCLG